MTRISILMYHQVGDFPGRYRSHGSTYCHYRTFRRQMAWLARWGYQVISLEQACAIIQGQQKGPRHAVVLTFDDAYQSFFQYALPQLRRYGFPATVFVVTGGVGGSARWLLVDGRFAPPLMDAATLRRLPGYGISLGAHTCSHPRLTRLPAAQAIAEISRSKQQLEQLLQRPIAHFCYPYGDYNAALVSHVRAAGFEAALSCRRGSAQPGDDLWQLPRKAISHGDSVAGFWWKLHMKHAPKTQALPVV